MPLSKKYRISKEKELKNVFSAGRTIRNPFLFLKFMKNNLDHPRFAVSVSKKIYKRAVKRNLAKRRIYHVLGQAKFLKEKNNFDIVITLTGDILREDFKKIKTEIEDTISKIFV